MRKYPNWYNVRLINTNEDISVELHPEGENLTWRHVYDVNSDSNEDVPQPEIDREQLDNPLSLQPSNSPSVAENDSTTTSPSNSKDGSWDDYDEDPSYMQTVPPTLSLREPIIQNQVYLVSSVLQQVSEEFGIGNEPPLSLRNAPPLPPPTPPPRLSGKSSQR